MIQLLKQLLVTDFAILSNYEILIMTKIIKIIMKSYLSSGWTWCKTLFLEHSSKKARFVFYLEKNFFKGRSVVTV